MVSHIPVLWRKGIPWHCEDLAAVGMRECCGEMTKCNNNYVNLCSCTSRRVFIFSHLEQIMVSLLSMDFSNNNN